MTEFDKDQENRANAFYRDRMEGPMEDLAMVLEKINATERYDAGLVEYSAKVIDKLYDLILLTGKYSPEEIKIILS